MTTIRLGAVAMLLIAVGTTMALASSRPDVLARGPESGVHGTSEGFKPRPLTCDPIAEPCLGAGNSFVRADVSRVGTWTFGTTGGDPDTTLDDDRTLLYGFVPGGASAVGSGYISVRSVAPDGSMELFSMSDESSIVDQFRDEEDGSIHTVWGLERPGHRISVTETIRLVRNAFSGRQDAVELEVSALNMDSHALDLGIRALLDVKIGDNDGAPYFIPGVGAVASESKFAGAAVPPYWIAFESEDFDPELLRGVGIVDHDAVTRPDEFWIVDWMLIWPFEWDYEPDPTAPVVKDSAVVLLWDQAPLAPGAQRTVSTRFGVAAKRGGSAFVTAPVEADCGSEFAVSLFVTNLDVAPLTGGTATLDVPPPLVLVSGSPRVRPFPDIGPGETGSTVWEVAVPAGATGAVSVMASATFDGGRSFERSSEVMLRCLPEPTPSATTTRPPTPVPPTSIPPETAPRACAILDGRVPPAAVEAALANPSLVAGWDELLNPGSPPSPSNPRRRWLTLRNAAVPYHPLFNPLVFKIGCP